MNNYKRPSIGLKLPPLGLVLQLFAIILLPLTLLLVVITFGSISIHQNAMRSLVGERDERAVNAAASALSAQIVNHVNELTSIKLLLTDNSSQPITATLSQIGYLMKDFDAGVAEINLQDKSLTILGNEQVWNRWNTNPAGLLPLVNMLKDQNNKVVIYRDPVSNDLIGLISEDIGGKGLIVGAFSLTDMVKNTLGGILPSDGQLSTLLVGNDQQVIYKVGNLSDQSASHPGVAQALQGQSGTVYVKASNGDEHVTAFSPVPVVNWALITEESWESVSTPTLRFSQTAPLALVPTVVILLLALYLGVNQVVRPLRTLESKAATLASGDYHSIQEPVGGIAEVQHLQKELIRMANKVKAAQRSLHRYIGAITDAQEDERKRLARDLHDVTLQALIALKQRVQLAQLELPPATNGNPSESEKLDEIENLTEQTIEDLRRVTRALRPIYLEDLGLATALEMLARESGQPTGVPVEFHHQGIERRLAPATELAIYRMSQESLNNVIRHARASHAGLNINFTVDSVTIEVTDDGVGFEVPNNPADFAPSGHFGLLGMYERAELIGATLEIQSSAGEGTHLIITLPSQSPV
jgi:signal transduction histidine kinase